ncbi:apolipoprotein L2-like isoform X1 [Sapajus apella]|uniref:Apolipoprotein L2-like isoform X1 n=2 Tax=Sapajus apella TaxID=9515 RepID=A0A6J3HFU7_SAPAP|nr:apolipoprotein L2-like isoform X1 [Sapajus apella]
MGAGDGETIWARLALAFAATPEGSAQPGCWSLPLPTGGSHSISQFVFFSLRMEQSLPGERVAGELPGNSVHNRFLEFVKSDTSRFIEDARKYIQDRMSTEQLLQLLTDAEAWERFVTAAELSRPEADELREALYNLARYMVVKDKNWRDKDQQHREWFLKEFPQLKKRLEEHISRVRVLADGVQQVHRGTTVASVVASSFGAMSFFLNLLSLGLAPVTDGLSLGLSEFATGLGLAAAGTGIISDVVEYAKKGQAIAESRGLIKSSNADMLKMAKEFMGGNAPNLLSIPNNSYKLIESIGKHIRAIRRARANFRWAPSAPPPEVIGRPSVQVDELAERVAERPALALSRGTKIVGMASGVILLVLDVVNLAYGTKHLLEGAESELAEELNKLAGELEEKLNMLTKCYEFLQADPQQ